MHLIKKANNDELKNLINTLKQQKSFEEKIIKEIINDCLTANSTNNKDELEKIIGGLNSILILLRSKQENVYDAIKGLINILEERKNQIKGEN